MEFFATVTVFLQEKELLKWTEKLTESAATAYDKAMDAAYIQTHIGGAEHRLFDGGHTVLGSWEATRSALNHDTASQQIVGWARAYMKDLTTPMGMPFVAVDKGDFDKWADAIARNVPGVDRQYLYDLLTFDVMEVITTGISLAAVCFAFQQTDRQKLAQILGAMGISSIAAANPIMGLATIMVTAYAYWKHGPVDLGSVVKGGGLTAFSAFMFSIMGLPIMVELAVILSLSIILRKHIFDSPEFVNWLKAEVHRSLTRSGKRLDFPWLSSLLPNRS